MGFIGSADDIIFRTEPGVPRSSVGEIFGIAWVMCGLRDGRVKGTNEGSY